MDGTNNYFTSRQTPVGLSNAPSSPSDLGLNSIVAGWKAQVLHDYPAVRKDALISSFQRSDRDWMLFHQALTSCDRVDAIECCQGGYYVVFNQEYQMSNELPIRLKMPLSAIFVFNKRFALVRRCITFGRAQDLVCNTGKQLLMFRVSHSLSIGKEGRFNIHLTNVISGETLSSFRLDTWHFETKSVAFFHPKIGCTLFHDAEDEVYAYSGTGRFLASVRGDWGQFTPFIAGGKPFLAIASGALDSSEQMLAIQIYQLARQSNRARFGFLSVHKKLFPVEFSKPYHRAYTILSLKVKEVGSTIRAA